MSMSEDSSTEVSSYETEEETQELTEGEETTTPPVKKYHRQPTPSSSTARTATIKNKKENFIDGVKSAFRKRHQSDDEEEIIENESLADKKLKRKKTSDDDDESLIKKDEKAGEKTFSKKKQDTPATKRKQAAIFDDSNVDRRFKIGCPQSVNPKKVSVNSNYMVSCKMIEANENKKGGLSYDYAGLIFQRRTKDSKCYEFNMPLSLTPVIISALNYIMSENKTFFAIQNTNNVTVKIP